MRQPDALAILSLCHTLIGRARYDECRSLASIAIDRYVGEARASALAFRAEAEYQLRDLGRASEDIREALTIYDAGTPASLPGLLSAYRLAYSIIGDRRYAETLRDIESVLDDEDGDIPLLWRERLTDRQQEVALLAAAGATNREIAKRLHVSSRTVGNSLSAIYDRLGIRARWQIAETAAGGAFERTLLDVRRST
jgi:DNA-binding CsgD family transcriptional regulator